MTISIPVQPESCRSGSEQEHNTTALKKQGWTGRPCAMSAGRPLMKTDEYDSGTDKRNKTVRALSPQRKCQDRSSDPPTIVSRWTGIRWQKRDDNDMRVMGMTDEMMGVLCSGKTDARSEKTA